MAISFSAAGSATGSTSASVTSLSVTAGQLITVVGVVYDTSTFTPAAGDVAYDAGSATIGTPTLDKYAVIDTGDAPYFIGLGIWSVLVTGSGSLSIRLTPSGASAACANHLSVWDGNWDSTRVESAPAFVSSATNDQTAHSSASASSAGAGLFLAGLALLQTGNKAITQDASFTLLTEYEDGTTVACGGASYRIVSSATTDTSDYTSAAGTSYGWVSGLVVYKEVGGGGSVGPSTLIATVTRRIGT